jgi:hypothetical protein
MITAVSFSAILAENLITILFLIALVVIVYFVTHSAVKIKGFGLKSKFAQMELEHKKIDALANKQKMENLREAASMLTDVEREKIESIKIDKGILARRTIALMAEIEERVARLERGTENAQLGKTLGDIVKNEKKLFKR